MPPRSSARSRSPARDAAPSTPKIRARSRGRSKSPAPPTASTPRRTSARISARTGGRSPSSDDRKSSHSELSRGASGSKKGSAKGSLARDFQLALPDSIHSAVLFTTVVLGGQWTDLCVYLVPSLKAYDLPVLLLWVFGTYALCCAYLPPGSFNPWVLLSMKLSNQQKALRILVQFATAIVFALVISLLDANLLEGKLKFDRDFIVVKCHDENRTTFKPSSPGKTGCVSVLPTLPTLGLRKVLLNGTEWHAHDGAILNEFAHTFVLNVLIGLAVPRAARYGAALPHLAIGAALVAVALSPAQTTGPAFNPLGGVLWAAMLAFDGLLGGPAVPWWALVKILWSHLIGTLGGVVVAGQALPVFERRIAAAAARFGAFGAARPARVKAE